MMKRRLRHGAGRAKRTLLPSIRGGQSSEVAPSIDKLDYVATYGAYTEKLLRENPDRDRALENAIGAPDRESFVSIGKLQLELLRFAGLTQESSVVEIGCGSGRLSVQLAEWLQGAYLGTDVVQALLDQAIAITRRPEWRFQRVTGLTIPAADSSADMVCAFSVFTHLLHEESYKYMEECHRVLRPGGKLVFSFVEYRVPSHWDIMELNIGAVGQTSVLNQFMSVDAITTWAAHLGLDVEAIYRGDEPYIPLSEPIDLRPHHFENYGTFGQSAAILAKRSGSDG